MVEFNKSLLAQGIAFLAQHGLNLFTVFECGQLPSDIRLQLTNEGISIAEYPRLVLIGNGGGAIWEKIKAFDSKGTDPVDDFSAMITAEFIEAYLEKAPSQRFYPGQTAVSLIRLGELAGWSQPSPLGLGINPEFGLWFAYRAAFVTSAEIPVSKPSTNQHPCDSCQEKPCIATCPVGAVSAQRPFDISTCYDFRLSANSPCRDRCLARLSCPVGRQHQYPLEQIQHHYDLTRRVAW